MLNNIRIPYNEEYLSVNIIRSDRQTICIEIKPDLTVNVRTPKHLPDAKIKEFVEEKTDWLKIKYELMIEKKTQIEKTAQNKQSYDDITVQYYRKRARSVITAKVHQYEKVMGVSVKQISIRDQKSRWGSCSSKGNVNFNWKLILMPENVLDYVVVHELAHLIEMNHSSQFWEEVRKVLPDYEESKRWLNENGNRY